MQISTASGGERCTGGGRMQVAQQAAAREVPRVVEHKSAQQTVGREEPAVQEHESRQHAVAN
jgi:hypothetical protein